MKAQSDDGGEKEVIASTINTYSATIKESDRTLLSTKNWMSNPRDAPPLQSGSKAMSH